MRACELRPSVKSTLMIGAAGAAATFGATGAFGDSAATQPPPSIHKYLPYAQIGGTSGDSMSTGDVTLFIPAWQALNQLLFIKVGGDLASGEGNFSTFGVGYRQKIAPRWIVGAFGNYDHTHTKLNDDFTQFVFGAELLNPDWEFHGNAYVADTGKIDLIKNSAKLEIDGNDIAIVREQEAPYSGFDGSGGYRAFKTPGTDGRLYAGGFYFKPSEAFDTKPIAGPKAGFEFNVYDLDFIGPQSRLQIQGEGRHDDVRGYTGFVGINLRVPLNIDPSGGGAQVLDELDRRMLDDPQTQGNVLTHSEFNKPEPVIIYGGSGGRTHPTNTIFYVDNSTGAGSYPNPTTFSDATTRGGDNALIVITTKEGDVSEPGVLAPGDMVIGAGTTLTIKGAETGYVFTHTFAPGEHDAVLSVPAGQTAITLASDNALYNFAIQGSFGAAIAGNNVGTATIRNLAITGDGSAGQKGIALTQDNNSKLDLLMTDTSVSGVGSDGISLATHLDGASTLSETISLSNVSVSSAGGNGVTFSTEATGGAHITQDITLDTVSVAGAGGIGIGIAGFAEGGGSQLTQTATVTDSSVTGAGGAGIAVYGYTSGGGMLTQNVSIDPTAVNNSGYALSIGAGAEGGILHQDVTVTDFSGSGNTDGVEIYAYGDGGASIYQTALLNNVSLGAAGHDGVRVLAHSNNGAYVNQGVEFDGLTLNGAGLYDIAVEAYADGGAIKQTALFNNVTINGSAQTAVDIYAETGNGGEGSFRPLPSGGENGNYYSLIQDVVFNTAAINTQGNGFYAGAKSSNGDSAAQYVSFSSDSTITAYDGGVTIYANASGNSFIHQQVHLPQVTLNGSIGGEGGEGGIGTAMGGGIHIETHSYSGANVDSYTLIDSASITYAANAAVSLAAYAQGGDIDQTLKQNNASISNYYETGISVYGDADGATLNQNALFDNVTVNGSGVPFTATAKSLDSGTINQYVSFTGDSALNSTDGAVSGSVVAGKYGIANQTLLFPNIDAHAPFGDDVSLTAEAYYGATAHQGVSFSYISSSHSSFGLAVDGAAFANGSVTQNVTADNIVATYEGGDGIQLEGLASSGAHLSQYLTINTATLTHDQGSGLYALLSELNGANALQMISLGNADTDGGGTGIKLHASTLNGGTAEQDAALNNISAQYETFSGIAFYANSSGNTIQRADISGLTANHDQYDGVRIKANIDSGTLGQYVSIADATFTYDNNGVNIYVSGYGGTSHQQATFSNLTVNAGNSGAGILLGAHGDTGADLYQAVTATNSHFDNNGVGIAANNHLVGGASLHQGIGLYSSSADYNSSGGISLYTYASGANTVSNELVAQSADISHNNGVGGIYMDLASSNSDIVTQSADIQNSTIDTNGGYGVRLRSGGGFNGSSYQSLVSVGDDISGNGVNGIFEAAQNVGVLQQILSSTGDTFASNGAGGIYQTARGNLVSQSSTIANAAISGNDNNPIFGSLFIEVYANSAGSSTARSITNTTVDDPGGIRLRTIAYGGGVLNNTTIGETTLTGGSLSDYISGQLGGFADEYLTLTNDTVTGPAHAGVYLHAYGSGGTALQHATIDGLSSIGNQTGLLAMTSAQGRGSIGAQYLNISNSHFDNNSNDGLSFTSQAGGDGAVTGQSVAIDNSTANGNTRGVVFQASGSYGGSANQYGHLSDVTVTGNSQLGILVSGTSHNLGFAAQTFILTATSDANSVVSGSNYGIVVDAAAYAGGNVEQGIGIYNTLISDIRHDGVAISANAYGGIGGPASYYYSHIAQNLNAYYDSFSHNGGDGISISNVANGGAQINSFAYLKGDTIDYNAGDGVHVYSHAGAGSNLYDDIYMVGGSASHNAGNGIVINSYADQSTYLIQHIAIENAAVNNNGGGESGGNGFVDNAHAQGQYSLNGQYITLAYSQFDGNNGAGAVFEAAQTYGPGTFGVARQYLTVVGSDFSHNTRDGLYAITDASGNQGRAEQHFTISGSQFDYNNGDGIHLKNYVSNGVLTYGTNANGTYPLTCNYVQSADGGCAFVRQTVDIDHSDISHNGQDGIYISTVLNHYAAAYNVSGRPLYTPTLYMNSVTVDNNAGNGLHLTNLAGDNSYEYQYIVAVNSHFDHNAGYGILSGSGASGGSSIYQKILLASVGGEGGLLSTVDHNGHGGIDIEAGGSYANVISTALVLAYTDVSHNGGNGVEMHTRSTATGEALQSFGSVGSNFAHNSGDGILLYSQSAGDGIAAQVAQSYGDTFTKNHGSGLDAQAFDSSIDINDTLYNSLGAAQSIKSVGDKFNGNNYSGITTTANFEAPAIAYQNLYVSGDSFKSGNNTTNLLHSSFQSGSQNAQVYRTVLGSTFAGGEGNAIDLSTTMEAGGFGVDVTTISNNTVRSAGSNGISVAGAAYNYATLYQAITMDGDHVSGSINNGVSITGNASADGKVVQVTNVTGLVSNNNGGDGFSLYGDATGAGSILAQYTTISGSTFTGNNGAGVSLVVLGNDALAVASQQTSIDSSTFTRNGTGIYVDARAIAGASANQVTALTGDTVTHNFGDGIRVLSYAGTQGFVTQGLSFDGTSDVLASITRNGGDGIYVSARAINGGEIEQNIATYYADISHNAGNGINISTYANGAMAGYALGHYYYSHISQNIGVGYGSITHNGGDGVHIVNFVGSGDGLNQYIGFYGETISANKGKGISEHSVAEAYVAPQTAHQTYLYSDLYMTGGSVTKNGAGGIDLRSYADGATYMIQHVAIQGAHIDHNKGDGISVIGSARGLYSLNIQYVTLAGSTFDHNTGNGVRVSGHQYYGSYGSFGSARQYVTIQQSDLSHNGQNGLYGNALSTDEQGSVVQDFTIVNSTINNNASDGVHLSRTASGGSYLDGYPCTSVQGVYGGCAFVRQMVQIAYSQINGNKSDGLYIGTNASNYGAVYSTGGRPKNTPTVVIYDSTLSHNGGDGMHLVNNVSGGSDVYQYVVAVDSHFDHNAGYGVEAQNNVTGGSTLFQNIVLYHYIQPDIAPAGSQTPMTVDNNGKSGVHITTYAGAGSTAYEGLALIGADISHNTGDGVYVSMRAIGAQRATQSLFAQYSNFAGNSGDGIHVTAYGQNGSNLSQIVTSRNNDFSHNGGDGLYVGFKESGVTKATQNVTSYFDNFDHNANGIVTNADFIGGAGKLSSTIKVGDDFVRHSGDGIDITLAASDNAKVAGFQKISYTSFTGMSNDAIAISVNGDTNARLSNTTQILSNGIQYAGHDGIDVNFDLTNGANLRANAAYQSPGVFIRGNTVTGHSGGEGGHYATGHSNDGIYVGFAVGSGGSIYEPGGERGVRAFDAVIANNTVSYVRGDGIHVATDNNSGTIDELSSIYGNTVNYATHGGIVVSHTETGGQSRVGESIHGNHVYAANFFGGEQGGLNGHEAGIEVTVTGNGGSIFDDASIYANTTEGHDIGITVETHGDKGTHQFASIYNNQIYRDAAGIYAHAAGSSYQQINYGSNALSQTGFDYYFTHSPAATQTLN